MIRIGVHLVIVLAAQAAAASVALAQAVGTAFTYQGALSSVSGPINGTADFQFSLWDADSGGTQLGVTHAINSLPVNDGLFTVELNGASEFGVTAFNGNARWLEIAVRSPAGSGAFVTLSPRQELTPTPLALALPGLRTEQTDDGTRVPTSPNVIGGDTCNNVTAGVVGATVAGGGTCPASPNRVTDDYGTVAGGANNRAGNNSGTTSDRTYATVGGGIGNTANGVRATIAGGDTNTANGSRAAIGGGFSNLGSGTYTTIPGGYDNTASADYSSALGGRQNVAAGLYSLAMGFQAQAAHDGAFVFQDSTATGPWASTAANQFLIKAAGGMGVGTNSPEAGTMLDVAGVIRSSTGGFKLPDGTIIDNAADLGSASFWQQTGSNIYYNIVTGRVGVGTSAPAAMLHVVHDFDTGVPSTFRVTSVSGISPFRQYALDFHFNDINATVDGAAGSLALNSTSSGNVLLAGGGGKVGIGDSSPAASLTVGDGDKFQVNGSSGSVLFTDDMGGITFAGTDGTNGPMITMFDDCCENGTRMVLGHSPGYPGWGLQYEDTTDRFYYTTDASTTSILTVDMAYGQVGVGTKTPSAKLHVAGTPGVDGIMFPDGTFQTTAATGGGGSGYWAAVGSNIYNLNSGNVGIGTGGGPIIARLDVREPATTGFVTGGFFRHQSTEGQAVYGLAFAASGAATGGLFESWAPGGRGVEGSAYANTGTNYGVLGNTSSAGGYGVYSMGNMGASGTKPFRIDHPSDPENKYLLHYASEGPEPQNVYNGMITLDAGGQAWVQLPDYFAEINRDFRYTLTPVGAAMPDLHVAQEISDNRFLIAGGKGNMKVSWEVKGVRNDLWVRTNGAPVEVEKSTYERGKYQHPELYGQLLERGMNYSAERASRLAEMKLADDSQSQ